MQRRTASLGRDRSGNLGHTQVFWVLGFKLSMAFLAASDLDEEYLKPG
jgi:hypothetical protein